MRMFTGIFWLIWLLAVVFIWLNFASYRMSDLILFSVLFVLVGINMYLQGSNRKLLLKVRKITESIDFKPLEEGIKKINRRQTECYTRIFGLETDLEQYKLDQERKYRDVVRKVLDLDNTLNRKFKLLGEAVIKLSKEIKEK